MATAAIGHNQPPTPFDALKAHIDDLDMEARNQLDGKPIENDAQAEAVSKLLDDARKAKSAADEQRKVEAKPFDDGKAAVQTLWKPLLERADLVAQTAKAAQTVWLVKKEDEKRAAVQAANEEAERLAAAARAAAKADPSDLAGQTTARVLQENAAEAAKQAGRLDKAPVQSRGGSRANSLRTYYTAEIIDPILFIRWAWAQRQSDVTAFLEELAATEARTGPRDIPGLKMNPHRKAV